MDDLDVIVFFVYALYFFLRRRTTMASNKTDQFKQKLQKEYTEILGTKISKDKAWAIFKAGKAVVVDFVINDKDNTLALSGVGKYEILKKQPRKVQGRTPKLEGKIPFLPLLRFRPSERIKNYLLLKMAGYDVKAENAKAAKAAEKAAAKTATKK